jgi:Protein of unknown function (DUF742)
MMSRYPSDDLGEYDPQPPRPADDDPGESRASRSRRLRSYALIAGRTRASQPGIEMGLETLVSITILGESTPGLSLQQRAIVQLCQQRLQSVAEISAHLEVPIGVAKVLLGDMIADGLLVALRPAVAVDEQPSVELLERVLAGLRTL